jgi:hypothetical protein
MVFRTNNSKVQTELLIHRSFQVKKSKAGTASTHAWLDDGTSPTAVHSGQNLFIENIDSEI